MDNFTKKKTGKMKIFISTMQNLSIIDKIIEVDFNSLHIVTANDNYSPYTFKNSYRVKENSNPTNLIVFDIDYGMELKKAVELCKHFKSLIVTTRNHQQDKKGLICDRYRILIPLSENIPKEDFKAFYTILAKFLAIDEVIDKSCNDLARFYFANINQEIYYSNSEIVIDTKEVLELVNKLKATQSKRLQSINQYNNNFNTSYIKSNELPNNYILKDGRRFEDFNYLQVGEKEVIRCFNAHHEDKNPSAFISRSNTNENRLFMYCSSCNELKFIQGRA
ncbi:MAG: hypothetical protein WC145_07145 [Aliarcobacter sp.]|jgi:hypothetical protein